MNSSHITEEQRDEIVERYVAKEPLKAIAADFGVYEQFVSRLALQRGARPRDVRAARARELTLKLWPAVHDRLIAFAKEGNTSPEVVAREAIAAYLGEG
ncbi:hypothetical protein [Bosea sp. BK604]|uniref:hypothetical protein n=1 Tax=Bosea sp. BK604 TaxID=2512180 RepID=UPI001052D3C1|nr:hypothetical protein [Bosea sp. BK604]TCR64672.1 hypothetical protein EV560_106137 [Bosea sp. BK604]